MKRYLLILLALSTAQTVQPRIDLEHIHTTLRQIREHSKLCIHHLLNYAEEQLEQPFVGRHLIEQLNPLTIRNSTITLDSETEMIIVDGLISFADIETYCIGFIGGTDDETQVTLYVRPLAADSLQFSHVHPSLKAIDTVVSLTAPTLIVSSHASDKDHMGFGHLASGITLGGMAHPRGKLAELSHALGIEALTTTASLPFGLDEISEFGVSFGATLNKVFANCITIDQFKAQVGVSDLLVPSIRTKLNGTFRMPHNPPLHCALLANATATGSFSCAGSMLGKFDMPFGIPISLGNAAGRFDFRIAEGIIPTGLGLNGRLGFTMPPKPPRELELGGFLNFPSAVPFGMHGELTYLSASDLYNFFPYMLSQIPLIYARMKDSLVDHTQYLHTLKEDMSCAKSQLKQQLSLLDRMHERLKEEACIDAIETAREHIKAQLKNNKKIKKRFIEQAQSDKEKLATLLEHLDKLGEKVEKVMTLANTIVSKRIPDFFSLKDVEVRLAPLPISIGDYKIKQGLLLKGSLLFPHLNAIMQDGRLLDATPCDDKELGVEVGISTKGIVGSGRMSPINIMLGDKPLIKVCDSTQCERGPIIDMALTRKQQRLVVKGMVSILDSVCAETDIVFGFDDAHFALSGDFMGLQADFYCSAPLNNLKEWHVQGNIKDSLTIRIKQFLKENVLHGKMVHKILDSFSLDEAGFSVALKELRKGKFPAIRLKGKIFGKKFSMNLKDVGLPLRDEDLFPVAQEVRRIRSIAYTQE